MQYDRIKQVPGLLGGQPCIRGMRLSVARVLRILATYDDRAEIYCEFPELEPDDIRQALEYSADMIERKRKKACRR